MVVIVLSGAPQRLRGDLTRWMYKIAPGIYVSRMAQRVRAQVWQRVIENIGTGRAMILYSANNEQGFSVEGCGYRWDIRDFDGLTLLSEPHERRSAERCSSYAKNEYRNVGAQRSRNGIETVADKNKKTEENKNTGWSIASRRRFFNSRGRMSAD